MNYYIIRDNVIVGKTTKKPLSNHIESEEDWPLGSSYIDGVFGEAVKSYDEALAELDAEYKQKFDAYSAEYGVAIFRDGLTESAKVTAARTKLTDLDAWYSEQSELLIIEYFS